MNELDKTNNDIAQNTLICNFCNAEAGRGEILKDFNKTLFCPVCIAPHKITKGKKTRNKNE